MLGRQDAGTDAGQLTAILEDRSVLSETVSVNEGLSRSGVASIKQMEQLLPPERQGPLL